VDTNPTGRVATALLVLLIPLSILIFGLVAPAAAGAAGPVTDPDKQLLIKVRQAGLWELPAGQQAQEQAGSQVVKDVGAKIATQLQQLDDETRQLARQLGVALPNQPTEEQQGWLADLSTKWGPEFDKSFANLLRAAHGKVFAAIAAVRAGTRNDSVRAFASKANDVIKTHMILLESTGQVDFNALPEPTLAGSTPVDAPTDTGNATATRHASVATAAQTSNTGGGVDVGLVIVICLVEFAVTLGLLRILRMR
jgi:predicted outer membrane protein